MTTVTREQFRIRSEVEIVHIPTGATFWTYPYDKPEDMISSLKAHWGEPERAANGKKAFDRQEVGRVAAQLILEQAQRKLRQTATAA